MSAKGRATSPVPPRASPDELTELFGGEPPRTGTDPEVVTDLLATGAEPGLMAIQRVSVSNWTTDAEDVRESLAAVASAMQPPVADLHESPSRSHRKVGW
jgi:hypothetical protein